MNKSLEFCKSKIDLPESMWREAYTYLPSIAVTGPMTFKKQLDGGGEVESEIVYDPEATFDYVASRSCRTDGTLGFTASERVELLKTVVFVRTYYKPLGEPKPGSFVRYTIGDMVQVLLNFGPDESVGWMRTRVVTMLPIKMEIMAHKPVEICKYLSICGGIAKCEHPALPFTGKAPVVCNAEIGLCPFVNAMLEGISREATKPAEGERNGKD